MKVKRAFYRLISILVVLIILLFDIYNMDFRPANAATASQKAAAVSLNKVIAYLHLGNSEKETFDFNVAASGQISGAAYAWYVNKDKGKPESVSINKKTGVVTAQKAGTAYIYCEVKLDDGEIFKPEAKVVVRNNITEVKISNLPENMTLTAGVAKNFDIAVLETEAGADDVTEGITRWEIADDTAGVVSASERGIVYPVKAGGFRIRAVSFQSVAKYKLWLTDKILYEKCITAASDWQTISVTASDGKAVANTQEQLAKALSVKDFNEITLSSDKAMSFTIEEGNYSSTSLIVDAPNADVANHGVFKEVTIKAIKDTTWIEYADGNIVNILDTQARLVVDTGAKIKRIVIDQPGCSFDLEINGAVGEISLLQTARINLSGSSSGIPVTVGEEAGDSTITTTLPLKLTLNAATEVVLGQGSEATSIDKSRASIEVGVTNNTTQAIKITTNNSGAEVIEAGKSGISNGASAVTGAPSYNPNTSDTTVRITGLTVSPSNMVLSTTGSAIAVAVLTPDNTTDTTVIWTSGDETVAIVDSEGEVTPVAEGTAPIVASAGGYYAITMVTVVSGAALTISGSAITTDLLGSAQSTVVNGLRDGAAKVGGEYLVGWGLSQMGLDGFKNESSSNIAKMQQQLVEMQNELKDLEASVKELKALILQTSYDIRVSNLIDYITVIQNTSNDLISYLNSSTPSQTDRDNIINTIADKIYPYRFKIYNELTGSVIGLTPLIKVWGDTVQSRNRFLSSADSDEVQKMYDYYEVVQSWELELLVEYAHVLNKGESYIKELVQTYEDNLTKEKSLMKTPIPENIMIDSKLNIMIYTGYYKTYSITGSKTNKARKAPLYCSIASWELTRMCYKLNYTNWRLLTYEELQSWVTEGKGKLNEYLQNQGWTCRLADDGRIIIVSIKGAPLYSEDYYGYDVDSGEESIQLWRTHKDAPLFYSASDDPDSLKNPATDFRFYWINCRTMLAEEVPLYIYESVIKKED